MVNAMEAAKPGFAEGEGRYCISEWSSNKIDGILVE